MENMGRKAAILAAAFTSVAALGAAYVYRNDIIYAVCDVVHPEWNAGEARLSDAYDRRFTLLNNGDGTETALYDDDTAVTFRGDEEGNLIWQYGTASLLAPIAANYFAFHGLSYPGGAMDASSMTYRPSGALQPLPSSTMVPGTSSGYARSTGRTIMGGGREDYEARKSDKTSSVSRKSGFGRAGIRSSGSS